MAGHRTNFMQVITPNSAPLHSAEDLAAEFMGAIDGVQLAPHFIRCYYFMQLLLQVWLKHNGVQLLLLHSS